MATPFAARRLTIALLAALVAVLASAGSAFAAPRTERNEPPKPQEPPKVNVVLSRYFREEQQRHKAQDFRLKGALYQATYVDKVIASMQAKGKDTTALQAAVDAYRAGIASARAEWQLADNTLAAHAGFDADGKVIDADAARATLKDAHSHAEQATRLANQAAEAFRKAMEAFRKSMTPEPKNPEPKRP